MLYLYIVICRPWPEIKLYYYDYVPGAFGRGRGVVAEGRKENDPEARTARARTRGRVRQRAAPPRGDAEVDEEAGPSSEGARLPVGRGPQGRREDAGHDRQTAAEDQDLQAPGRGGGEWRHFMAN